MRVWLNVYSPSRRSPPDGSTATRRAIILCVGAAFAKVIDSWKATLARRRVNGDVRQPELFDAALVADAEIDSGGPAQVRGQAPDENVVFGCHGALDAASPGQARTRGHASPSSAARRTIRVAHDHSQGALARQVADSFGKRDHFAQPRPAWVAAEQMLLDGFLFGTRQRGEPVVGEDRRVDGIRAAHAATPMHSRSW